MLNLLRTSLSRDGREWLFDEIKEKLASGKRIFLLVPEQQTLSFEKQAAKLLPPSAPLTFEVTNFSRLANTVFRKYGGVGGEYSDQTANALLMWQALGECAPLLTHLKEPQSDGNVNAFLSAVREAEISALAPEDLNRAAEKTAGTDPRLSEKLRALAVVYATWKKLTDARYNVAEEDVPRMTSCLASHTEFFDSSLFYFFGFDSFTEQQNRFLQLLLSYADATVLLPYPAEEEGFYPYAEVARTYDKLLRAADLAATPKTVRAVGGPSRVNDGIAAVGKMLFRAKPTFAEGDLTAERVRVFAAEDAEHEALFVASDILRKVSESGEKYSSFAIVSHDMTERASLYRSVFAKCKIPLFLSTKRDILSYQAVKAIFSAYAVVTGGFMREDVVSFAKCGFCKATPDEVDTFEIYTQKWNLSGKALVGPELLSLNPDGYTTRKSKDYAEVLREVNDTRNKILTPLLRLKSTEEGNVSVRDHAAHLFDFLTEIEMEKALRARALHYRKVGDDISAKDAAALFEILMKALDRVVEISGDCVCGTDGFFSLLKIAFGVLNVGRLPARLDEVTAGSAASLRLSDVKHVYLVGVNDGEFPCTVSDGGYFSDRDRKALAGIGIETDTNREIIGAREYFAFSRAFLSGSDSVTLLYTERSRTFASMKPAAFLGRLCEASPILTPKRLASLSAEEKIYAPPYALASVTPTEDKVGALESALRKIGYDSALDVAEKSLCPDRLTLSEDTVNLLYPGAIGLTQSIIDTFVDCPLKHFCTYVLELDSGKDAEFKAGEIGTMVHEVLECFLRDAQNEKRHPADYDADERQARIRKYVADFVKKTSGVGGERSARDAFLLEKIIRSAGGILNGLIEEISGGQFVPSFFELRIQKRGEGSPEAIVTESTNGTPLYVYGVIDRVDTYESDGNVYLRVLDYKTGKKDFHVKDLENARNLQMFLYLRSLLQDESFAKAVGLKEGGRLIPAGVLYLGARIDSAPIDTPSDDAETIFRNSQKRQGMMLDDPKVNAAMNPNYLPTVSNGKRKRNADEFIFTEESWKSIESTLDSAVRKVGDGLLSGNLSPTPQGGVDSPCAYCDFKTVCRRKG